MTSLRILNAVLFILGLGAGLLGLAQFGSSKTVFQELEGIVLVVGGGLAVGIALVVEGVAKLADHAKESNRTLTNSLAELERITDQQRVMGEHLLVISRLAERQVTLLERLKKSTPANG